MLTAAKVIASIVSGLFTYVIGANFVLHVYASFGLFLVMLGVVLTISAQIGFYSAVLVEYVHARRWPDLDKDESFLRCNAQGDLVVLADQQTLREEMIAMTFIHSAWCWWHDNEVWSKSKRSAFNLIDGLKGLIVIE